MVCLFFFLKKGFFCLYEKRGIITVRNDGIYVVDFDLIGSIDAFIQKNEPIIEKGGVGIGLVKGLQSS